MDDSRLVNLAKANEVRVRKAEFKKVINKVAEPQALSMVADALESDQRLLDSFSIKELLMAIPGVGREKARLLARAAEGLELMTKVGAMTTRRRTVLAEVLRERGRDREKAAA